MFPTENQIVAKAIEIEPHEISPGIYRDLSPTELADVIRLGARDARRLLAPKARRTTVTAYRTLVLGTRDALNLNALGRFWAWDADTAESWWGGAGTMITLRGVVASSSVDWLTSAALVALRGYDEAELRLYGGAPVRLTGVDEGDGWEAVRLSGRA